MNNLLFLGLIILISIIICLYFDCSLKEGLENEEDLLKKRLESKDELLQVLNSTSCTIDDRCDYIDQSTKEVMVLNEDGKYDVLKKKRYDSEINPNVIEISNENNVNERGIQTNLKIEPFSYREGMTNMSAEQKAINMQQQKCNSNPDCANLGENCGWCNDYNTKFDGKITNIGRVIWTSQGEAGSGTGEEKIAANAEGGTDVFCSGESWFYPNGDQDKINSCQIAKDRKLCSLIKSCEDFNRDDLSKELQTKLQSECGFCPTTGKGVPTNPPVLNDAGVEVSRMPKYTDPLPDGSPSPDICPLPPDLQERGTLGPGQECTDFLSNNPCLRDTYSKGPHSPECYADLFKKRGSKYFGDIPLSKKDAEWFKRDRTGSDRMSGGEVGSNPNNNEFIDMASNIWLKENRPRDLDKSVPSLTNYFDFLAQQTEDPCYKNSNEAKLFYTDVNMDPCAHQEKHNRGNKFCQPKKEEEVVGEYLDKDENNTALKRGTILSHLNNYNGAECESFRTMEEWLERRNIPVNPTNYQKYKADYNAEQANAWGNANMEEAAKQFKEGTTGKKGNAYKDFLKGVEQVMYSGRVQDKYKDEYKRPTSALRYKAAELLKGVGEKPPPPPPMREGDYVEYVYSNVVLRGTLYKLKTEIQEDGSEIKKALVMWDYFKGPDGEVFRGPTMGVCMRDVNNDISNFNLSDCILGLNAHFKNTSDCDNYDEGDQNRKNSCKRPSKQDLLGVSNQRKFGWPQEPLIKATQRGYGQYLSIEEDGYINAGYLSVIKRCKTDDEGCGAEDLNCEDNLKMNTNYYKPPQDCRLIDNGWTNCTKPCGGGTQTRTFEIEYPQGEGGLSCNDKLNELGPHSKSISFTENKRGNKVIDQRACNTQTCHPNANQTMKITGPNGNCLTQIYTNNGPIISYANCEKADKWKLEPITNPMKPQTYKFRYLRSNKTLIDKGGLPPGSGPRLDRCEGDCDSDNDCIGNLKCYQRDSSSDVPPGCVGGGSGDDPTHDYCYDPADNNTIKTIAGDPPSGVNTTWSPQLDRCEGDCDTDADCKGNLKCFQRNNGEPVPGCSGNPSRRDYDYCYDPNWNKPKYLVPNINTVELDVYESARGADGIQRQGPTDTEQQGKEGSGRLGLGNTTHSHIKIEKDEQNPGIIRLRREKFSNMEENENILDKIVNGISDFFSIFDVNEKPKEKKIIEGAIGSRVTQHDSSGSFMGQSTDGNVQKYDTLSKSAPESKHRVACVDNGETPRVGLYKCNNSTNSSKNGILFPFKSNVGCSEGTKWNHCASKNICEYNCPGGNCTPHNGKMYIIQKEEHKEPRSNHSPSTVPRSHNGPFRDSKFIISTRNFGSRINVDSYDALWDFAKPVNTAIADMHVSYDGADQGWGNRTGSVRVVLFNKDRQIEFNGRFTIQTKHHRNSYSRNSWTYHEYNYTTSKFASGKIIEPGARIIVVHRTTGWGHQSWLKNMKITFNRSAKNICSYKADGTPN